MADKKVEQWRAERGHPSQGGFNILADTYLVAYVCYTTDEILNEANTKLICALHNAALDINPSNPMAVAENMKRAIFLLDKISDWYKVPNPVKIKEVQAWLSKARELTAAITKPLDSD